MPVERVQTGVRIERRLLKVLKALAEYLDISLGDLIEGIALHAFEGRLPFDQETLHAIDDLKKVYGLTLRAEDSHMLVDEKEESSAAQSGDDRRSEGAASEISDERVNL